ncbi:hypothetical protein [Brevundimonas sp. Root1279]|uniref:hypothetical protein n=1 Tax=Brevundimonas sp. Root1279 TaxID=1736443 RepID=UPI0006F34BE7|nr:hypothetical protein [Brevundimonas sp. Root1279]
MTAVRPGGGTLIAKYLIGLLLLIVGVALILFGSFEGRGFLTTIGVLIAAIGILLIVMKVIARNRPPG